MSSYKVIFIDEILNKVHVDLSYTPQGEVLAKTISDYFDTNDFSLVNIQAMSVAKLEKFIIDTDASLKPVKNSDIPPETKAIIGVEITLEGVVIPVEEPPFSPAKATK